MSLSPNEMRGIYEDTVIIKKPTFGIVSGYHELPYICVGRSSTLEGRALCVRGKVEVSPRFVVRPAQYAPRYEEVFGEENVDVALVGRVFGFMGFPRHQVECASEDLEIQQVEGTLDEVISRCLDDLARREDITTGVVMTPDSQYYPISIERFIASVLEDEFAM